MAGTKKSLKIKKLKNSSIFVDPLGGVRFCSSPGRKFAPDATPEPSSMQDAKDVKIAHVLINRELFLLKRLFDPEGQPHT